ncbi:EpsG family protein [Proteus penneri]|uniref:EpsG family protein n=1 Tax=Proteus penneri TaxID=102862 RepID=UPI00288ACBDC|nr:EpsG family protein [Proteus penneri]
MIVYYFLLFSFIFFSFLDVIIKKNDKLFITFIMFLFLSFFWGLRYKLGVDWLFYIDEYNQKDHTLSIEYGYKLTSSIFSRLGISYFLFQFFITIFFLFAISYFYGKYSRYRVFCILSLFLFNFIFYIEAIRQVIALSLVIISYNFTIKSKYLTSFALIILASLFHVSALILIVSTTLFFLNYNKIYKLLLILLSCFFLLNIVNVYPIDIILFFLKSLVKIPFIEKVYWYTQEKNSILTISLILKLLVTFVFFRKTKHIEKNKIISFIKYNLIFLLLINLSIGMYGTISTRLEVYYIPILILSLSYIITLTKNILKKCTLLFIFISYFSVSFIKVTNIDYFKNHYTPYNNYLIIDEYNKNNYREKAVEQFWREKKNEQ